MPDVDRRSDAEYEYLIRRNSEIAHTIRSVTGNVTRYAGFMFAAWIFAYYGYLSIKELSGETTVASIAVRIITLVDAHIWVSWAVTGSAVVLWNREKNLRKRQARRNSQLEKDLQKSLDRVGFLEKRDAQGLDLLAGDDLSRRGILDPEDLVED